MNRCEPWLGDAKATVEVLRKHGIHFKKKYGQNFLIDKHVLGKILEAAEIGSRDFVLEIGPGIGTLTQYLSSRAREVLAVEIDRELIPVLEDTLSGFENVTVMNADILETDIRKIADEKNNGEPIKIAANLPYYITTPIVMGILESKAPVSSMTFMVQKEVAGRMAAAPGSKEYGALSLAVQYYCDAEVNATVPLNCFMPRPDVTSAVITLKTKPQRIRVNDEELMFKVIRSAFAQRRKTLVNCLRNSNEFVMSRETAEEVVGSLGLPLDIRGENLSLEQFAALSDTVGNRLE